MENEPDYKCQRNCWPLISEVGAVLNKDKLTALECFKWTLNMYGLIFFNFLIPHDYFFIPHGKECVYKHSVCVRILYEEI